MSSTIGTLIGRIRELESQLEAELAARQADLKYRIERGRVIFEEDVLRRQRELKTKLLAYIAGARPLVLVTAPFIYALIVPLLLLDLAVSVYQAACFPVYGIPKARRGDYIVFDRHLLPYLNAVEKLNCAYCSYANGLVAYVREIASRTEQYWCPIKHARRLSGSHQRYPDFVDFGDGDAYRRELESLRARLKDEPRA
jgi:hypothetical protein